MFIKKLTYFYNCHGSNNPPSPIYKIGPLFIQWYSPEVNKIGLELMFINRLIWFKWFIKKYTYWYKKERTTKPGVLKRFVLNFGSLYVSFFVNKDHLQLYMDRLQPFLIPENYFQLKTEKENGKTWHVLYQNMIRYYDKCEPLYRIIRLREWNYKPTTKGLKHEIMLNDWRRWNTELGKDKVIEISEYVYNEMLNCLPPKNWSGNYFEVGEPHHHENGKAIHRAFIKVNDQYFTGHPDTLKELVKIKVYQYAKAS